MRVSFNEYFLQLAELTSKRSTCQRLKVGAVIVKNNRILSTGYNGSIKGHEHCIDVGCLKNDEGRCIRCIHAEANALLFAKTDLEGAVIYVTHYPCENCSKLIAQSGIKKIVYKNEYENTYSREFLRDLEVIHFR
ncbi:dCMP deaminase family protein [Shouchella clausii]|uniref:deoxycytidylate deaminase n=1 Tax=Shouchella clausii TaxID=79880 RepID=UPI002DB599E3|nr:dCMP deaminase family protein [Shouchella clausii]MEB5480920.1 dCMP deaminase family protein [Shouchella clausii]